jgi:hypothetical protein
VRAPHFTERKNAINDRCEVAGMDDLRDFGEFLAVRSSAQPDAANTVFFCFVFGWRLNE